MPLDIAAPVAGLQVGPATEATVRAILGITDSQDDVALALAINTVNDVVIDFRFVANFITSQNIDPDDLPDPLKPWRARIVGGASLLAARVFRRKNSTEGVAALGAEGAVYIQRNDPDVAMMLKLGTNAEPAVG